MTISVYFLTIFEHADWGNMQAFLDRREPLQFGHLLLPEFSQLGFSCSVEPFRLANTVLGQDVYHWTTISVDGAPVPASNGLDTDVVHSASEAPPFDILFVHSSYAPQRAMTGTTLTYLRKQARFGSILAGVECGGLILARAGLLDGYQATSHWEVLESMAETYPEILVKRDVFVFDRDRITVAGGAAAMDMALTLIAARHGHDLATRMAEEFVLPGIRSPDAPQRFTSLKGFGNANVGKAIAYMEDNIGNAVPVSDVAAHVGITLRALERLFERWLKTSPAAYYREMRLRRARTLLQQTDLPIIEVAIMNGFSDSAHFSRTYKSLFGHPPSMERKIHPQ